MGYNKQYSSAEIYDNAKNQERFRLDLSKMFEESQSLADLNKAVVKKAKTMEDKSSREYQELSKLNRALFTISSFKSEGGIAKYSLDTFRSALADYQQVREKISLANGQYREVSVGLRAEVKHIVEGVNKEIIANRSGNSPLGAKAELQDAGVKNSENNYLKKPGGEELKEKIQNNISGIIQGVRNKIKKPVMVGGLAAVVTLGAIFAQEAKKEKEDKNTTEQNINLDLLNKMQEAEKNDKKTTENKQEKQKEKDEKSSEKNVDKNTTEENNGLDLLNGMEESVKNNPKTDTSSSLDDNTKSPQSKKTLVKEQDTKEDKVEDKNAVTSSGEKTTHETRLEEMRAIAKDGTKKGVMTIQGKSYLVIRDTMKTNNFVRGGRFPDKTIHNPEIHQWVHFYEQGLTKTQNTTRSAQQGATGLVKEVQPTQREFGVDSNKQVAEQKAVVKVEVETQKTALTEKLPDFVTKEDAEYFAEFQRITPADQITSGAWNVYIAGVYANIFVTPGLTTGGTVAPDINLYDTTERTIVPTKNNEKQKSRHDLNETQREFGHKIQTLVQRSEAKRTQSTSLSYVQSQKMQKFEQSRNSGRR